MHMLKHNFRLLFLSFLWIGSLLCQPCLAQNVPSRSADLSYDVIKQIDELFVKVKPNSPGYAIGIVKGDKILYLQGYGSANLDYGLPITQKSAFSLASVSKQFTGACIAQLIQEGKLSLETSAKDFVPALEKYKEDIQIKHLIYNTSGIIDYPKLKRKNGKSWITYYHFDIEECIETSLAQDTLAFKPGEQWDYCNVNWMLLTKVVEKISGKPFDEYIQEYLFQPLGMSASLVHTDITQVIPNRVTPYNERSKDNVDGYNGVGIYTKKTGNYIQHPRISPHYGGSGVVSTVEDLASWCMNFHTKKVGGEAFYKLMHQAGTFPHGRNNQAFGLYLGDFNGKKIAAWDGGDWGISSQIMRFLEEKVGIICLSNLGSGESFRKVNQIADILMEAGEL